MKNIILILSLAYFANCKAQTPYPSGSYQSKPELNKFVGTWVWASGSDSLILHLYKQAIHYPTPLNYDVENIVGWHKYISNGTVTESSIQYSGQPYVGGHSSIFAWGQSPIKLYGTFDDLTKNKSCDLYLTMTNATNTLLNWKLKEPRGIRPTGFQYGFTLPTNLTLTKQ
jgi:hypothetical protein